MTWLMDSDIEPSGMQGCCTPQARNHDGNMMLMADCGGGHAGPGGDDDAER